MTQYIQKSVHAMLLPKTIVIIIIPKMNKLSNNLQFATTCILYANKHVLGGKMLLHFLCAFKAHKVPLKGTWAYIMCLAI